MHFIERLVIIANESTITAETIKKYWDGREYSPVTPVNNFSPSLTGEKAKIVSALEQCGYNISKTAHLLNIDRGTLYNRLRKYEIEIKKSSRVSAND